MALLLVVMLLGHLPGAAAQGQEVEGEPEAAGPAAPDALAVVEGEHAGDGAFQEALLAWQELEGRTISRLDFQCDLALCQSPVELERFRDLSGLYVGQPLRRENLVRAEQRLAKTGYFSSVRVTTALDGERVQLGLEAVGAVLIRQVRFVGNSPPPFESELRKLLIYRPGQPWDETAARRAAQLASLRTLFEREGYFDTKMELRAEAVAGQTHLVDVVIAIKKGPALQVCDIGMRGVRAMPQAEARALLLSAVSVFARRLPLVPPAYTAQQFREGREALIQRYRAMGYFRARLVAQGVRRLEDRSCVQLAIDINEGPRWDVVFEGQSVIRGSELRASLPFDASGFVDQEEISRAENLLRKLYETRGYPLARVRGREEVRDGLDRSLIFVIEEGPRLRVGQVRLEGTRGLDPGELLVGMGTRTYSLFAEGGYLQTEQLLDDVARMEQAARARGYMQAVVAAISLEVTADGRFMDVVLHLQEGLRTQAGRVDFQGNRVFTAAALAERLKVQSGQALVPLELKADQSRIVQLYAARGYPLARVATLCRSPQGVELPCETPELPTGCLARQFEELEALCRVTREASGESPAGYRRHCQRRRPAPSCQFGQGVTGATVHVRHVIEEGPRVQVGEVLVKGNHHTRPEVILRELPLKKGDLFQIQKLLEGQGNLRSLGIFDSVSLEAIGLDESARQTTELVAALVVSVEESRSRFVDFRFGLEGRDVLGESQRLLLTGELLYNNSNAYGLGQRFRPRLIAALNPTQLLDVGALALDTDDAAEDARGLDFLLGAELVFHHPRFLKAWTQVDKISLTVTPFYLLDLLGVTNEQLLREEWGLRLDLRKELVALAERLFISVGLEAKQAATWSANDLVLNGNRLFSPRRATGKISPELSLDRRDQPLNPNRGFQLRVQPQLVSGDALSSGEEDVVQDAFVRLSAQASLYLPLTSWLTLAQGLRAGQVLPLFGREALVPPDERYYLGGVGSVRGFPANTLGPLGRLQQPTGGEMMWNYTAEMRFPVWRRLDLHGAAFFDAGILADCQEDGKRLRLGQCYAQAFGGAQAQEQVRSSAGLGLRYLVAGQIPLVVDYGVVLGRQAGEAPGSLHFNLGYGF